MDDIVNKNTDNILAAIIFLHIEKSSSWILSFHKSKHIITYYDCRLLGLKTNWTADTGLVIDKNEDYFYEYLREVNNSKNAKSVYPIHNLHI